MAILGAAAIGLCWALGRIPKDRLPFYFLIHLLTLPVIRMFETPAHDGVRLFLPAFFFLAAFAGWGAIWLADVVARMVRVVSGRSAAGCLGCGASVLRRSPWSASIPTSSRTTTS